MSAFVTTKLNIDGKTVSSTYPPSRLPDRFNMNELWAIATSIGDVTLKAPWDDTTTKWKSKQGAEASIDFNNGPSKVTALGSAPTGAEALHRAVIEARRLSPPTTIPVEDPT